MPNSEYGEWMHPLDPRPALIDRAYERLVEAIPDSPTLEARRAMERRLAARLPAVAAK